MLLTYQQTNGVLAPIHLSLLKNTSETVDNQHSQLDQTEVIPTFFVPQPKIPLSRNSGLGLKPTGNAESEELSFDLSDLHGGNIRLQTDHLHLLEGSDASSQTGEWEEEAGSDVEMQESFVDDDDDDGEEGEFDSASVH